MPSLLLEQIERHATQRPSALAAVESGADGDAVSINWRQFRDAIGALAFSLRWRFEPGSIILLIAPSSVRYLIAFHACLAADMTVFPLSVHSTPSERLHAARQSGAAGCISEGEPADAMKLLNVAHIPLHSVPIDGAGPIASQALSSFSGESSMLLQSSGTTGLPKIVRRSLSALIAVGENCRRFVGMTPDDRMLAVIPISHSYGIDHAVLAATLAGCTVELSAGFDAARTAARLASQQITLFPAVPFIFEALVQSSANSQKLTRLRHAFSAGSPLPRRVFDAFHHSFDVPIGQIYGSTEFGSITFNDPTIAPFDPLSVGRPMCGVKLRIVDRDEPRMDAPLPANTEGQLAVAAASMFDAYLAQRDSALTDGWFLPADLARLDEHGRLTITGRTKLLIDVGGLKVNPLEVEAALAEHPDVREAIVVPVSLSETVQRVKAFIVWREGAGDLGDLRAFAQKHLAPHKVPRVFEECESLPRTPTGKVLRSALQTT